MSDPIDAASGHVPVRGVNVCEVLELGSDGVPARLFFLGNYPDEASATAAVAALEANAARNHENSWYTKVYPDGSER